MQAHSGIGNELMALEKHYWEAIQDKDASTAVSLSDDPCVVVGAQGVGEIDRQALRGMIEGAGYDLKRFDFEEVKIRPLTDDVVIVAYKVREDLEVDGEELEIEAYDSSVWIRRRGQWVCALHTESLAGDPFGRPASRRSAGTHRERETSVQAGG